MNALSDYLKFNSDDSELDAILAEVKNSKQNAEAVEDEPAKTWSMDDIDRLIAMENGEEYVPVPKKETVHSEDLEKFLSHEFDTGMFTVKPLVSEEKEEVKDEYQDISSVSTDSEVDGQEKFYEPEEVFDESYFEIETVIVPEDAPKPAAPMFAWQEKEPEKPKKTEPSQIKTFYEGETAASDFFTQKPEENEHISEADYRTRFFSTLKLERTAEIEPLTNEPIDRSGIIVEKSGESVDGTDLEAMPRVLAAEDVKEIVDEKTRVMEKVGASEKKERETSDDVEGQIVLTGFDDEDESSPETARENDVEASLWEKRKQKAKNFRIVDSIDLDTEFEGDFEVPPEERAKEEKARKRKQKRIEIYNSSSF